MTLEEQLKQEILQKYKSIRAFTTAINIPYSTLDSVFKRGIANAGVSTVLKIFHALSLDIDSIPSGTLLRTSNVSDESLSLPAKKMPPAPEDAGGAAEKTLSYDALIAALVAMGLIHPGEELFDDDLAFLSSIVQLFHAWFQRR